MSIETVILTAEDFGIRLELPAGWSIDADEDGDLLACVAGDDWDDDGFAPSITVLTQMPLADDDDDLDALVDASLEQMRESYDGFELLSSDRDGTTVTRVYEFEPSDLGRRVRQVQGIVADLGLWIVHGTTPLVFAEAMEPLFRQVIASVSRLED